MKTPEVIEGGASRRGRTVAFACSGFWLTPPARGSPYLADRSPDPLAALRLPQRESVCSVNFANLGRVASGSFFVAIEHPLAARGVSAK